MSLEKLGAHRHAPHNPSRIAPHRATSHRRSATRRVDRTRHTVWCVSLPRARSSTFPPRAPCRVRANPTTPYRPSAHNAAFGGRRASFARGGARARRRHARRRENRPEALRERSVRVCVPLLALLAPRLPCTPAAVRVAHAVTARGWTPLRPRNRPQRLFAHPSPHSLPLPPSGQEGTSSSPLSHYRRRNEGRHFPHLEQRAAQGWQVLPVRRSGHQRRLDGQEGRRRRHRTGRQVQAPLRFPLRRGHRR